MGVHSGSVSQQRTVSLHMQVLPQLLVTAMWFLQPLAWAESHTALKFVSCCLAPQADYTRVDPHSLGVITSSFQPPWSALPIIRRMEEGAYCWQAKCVVATREGPYTRQVRLRLKSPTTFFGFCFPSGLSGIAHLCHDRGRLIYKYPWPMSEIGTVLGLCV